VLDLLERQGLCDCSVSLSCYARGLGFATYDELLGDASGALNGRVLEGKHGVVLLCMPIISGLALLFQQSWLVVFPYVEGTKSGAVLIESLVVELSELLWRLR
jgi:hypothetical protein